jgi:purine nucleoside phosphorylase
MLLTDHPKRYDLARLGTWRSRRPYRFNHVAIIHKLKELGVRHRIMLASLCASS